MGKTVNTSAGNSLSELRLKTRDLNTGFNADKEEWKKLEKQFTDEVLKDLDDAVQEMAESSSNWRKYLQVYAEAPQYSLSNRLWICFQLSKKGVDGGKAYSESVWRALGRRVKEEYVQPKARRDKEFGYDNDRDWNTKYAAEITSPLSYYKRPVPMEDSNGNLVLDKDGKQKVKWVNTRPRAYKTDLVYHEDATEGLDGGPPPALDTPEWESAKGPDEASRKLIGQAQRCLARERIEYREESRGDDPAATYDYETGKVIFNSDAPEADQATMGMKAFFVASTVESNDTDEARKKKEAAAESAKYVIATLYGLDSDAQTFPHLGDIAEKKGGLMSLSGLIHKNVSKVMANIDPVTKAKTHQSAERRKKSRSSRRKRAKKNIEKVAA